MRRRTERQPAGKRICIQERDLALFDALQRHCFLPTTYLYELTKDLGGNYQRLQWRLEDLYHETGHLDRPHQQFNSMHARYQPLVYALIGRSRAELRAHGRLHEFAAPPNGGYVHDFFTSCITGSIEIAAREAGFAYVCQEDVLRKARPKFDKHPLELPATITQTIKGVRVTSDRPAVPDELFGIGYGAGFRFFAVEYDRGTEPLVRNDLSQNSFLRKVLAYKQILSEAAYKQRLGIPNLLVLFVTTTARRVEHMLEVTSEVCPEAAQNLLYTHVPHFTGYLRVPPLLRELFTGPWRRAGKGDFYLNQP